MEAISHLGFLVQLSPATGRAGRCRQGALQTDVAVCGEHSPCSGHTGFAPYRGVCAFPVHTAQAPGCSIWNGPCAECGSSLRVLHSIADSVAPACCVFPGLSGSGSQRLVRVLPGAVCLFPPVSGPGGQRLGRPLPGRGAPFPSAVSGSGSQRLARTLPGCGAPFPSAASAWAARGLCGLSTGAARLFPPWPQRAPQVGSQEVFK